MPALRFRWWILPACLLLLLGAGPPPAGGIAAGQGPPPADVDLHGPGPSEDSPPPAPPGPAEASLKDEGKGRITLKLKEVPVADVIRLIAEFAELNVIIDKDVQEPMTIKLSNVSWQEALETVLDANGLDRRQVGSVMKVAPRDKIAQEEQEQLKSRREKEVVEDLQIQSLAVQYLSAKELLSQVEPMLSARGSVRANERTNALIVKDIPSKIQEIQALLTELDRKVPQVLIEAKILVAEKKVLEELGVKWGGVAGWEDGRKFMGVRGGLDEPTGLPDLTKGDLTLPSTQAVNVPTAASPLGGLGFAVGKIGSYNLDVQLAALEDDRRIQILSSPKLLVLDNQSATISQGQEVPYKSTTTYYTSTEFKSVELSLEVKPHITSSKSISLEVTLKNDTLAEFTVDGQPVVNKQHVTTTLLLEDGETAAIGGILQTQNRETKSGVPFLSRIPVLGWAFKGRGSENQQRELMIFLTPGIT
ncbi:MAG: type IV pilus secretin PilQ [bacterium]